MILQSCIDYGVRECFFSTCAYKRYKDNVSITLSPVCKELGYNRHGIMVTLSHIKEK